MEDSASSLCVCRRWQGDSSLSLYLWNDSMCTMSLMSPWICIYHVFFLVSFDEHCKSKLWGRSISWFIVVAGATLWPDYGGRRTRWPTQLATRRPRQGQGWITLTPCSTYAASRTTSQGLVEDGGLFEALTHIPKQQIEFLVNYWGTRVPR